MSAKHNLLRTITYHFENGLFRIHFFVALISIAAAMLAGVLLRYTMGVPGALEIALSVPPWKPLRELTAEEIRTGNLSSVETLADVLPGIGTVPMVSVTKPTQDRFAGEQQKTAEIKAPTVTVNTENK